MRLPPAVHWMLRTCCAVAAVVSIGPARSALAQPLRIQLGVPFGTDYNRFELTSPHVSVVPGTVVARLEQVDVLAAEGLWDEAIETLRELAADDSEHVVTLDDGRYVGLREYCHLRMTRLPAEALAEYRRRVDPLAERWYRDGLAGRDEALLHRVVDEHFCSSWTDDALLVLGELALGRADYAAARRAWQQISPLLRDPSGRPLWLALRDVDLDASWPEIEHRWFERTAPPDWLAYPDTTLELADIQARLVLVSIRAEQFDRAALELDVFRRMHPRSEGRLGGQEGSYAEALERLLATAHDWPEVPREPNWPTFAGSPSRGGIAPPIGSIAGPAWSRPIELATTEPPPADRFRVFNGALPVAVPVREAERPLSCFPVIVDGVIVYGDAQTVHAAELSTGRPAITRDGVVHRAESFGDADSNPWRSNVVSSGVPRFTFTAVESVLLARVGNVATSRLQPSESQLADRLVGLDLERDGLLSFRARPDDHEWAFDGTPVSDGRRVFVAMRRSEMSPRAYVACFDLASGRRMWRTSIGAADTPASGRGDEITHNLLTLVGDRVYFNTNLGLVAALDAADGRLQWLHRYERAPGASLTSRPLHFDRDPAPCLYHDGMIFVAPSDTPHVFALDADTGKTMWTTNECADVLHLLGVVDDALVASGNRLWLLDVRSGRARFVWPESETAGIRGMGRGVIAESEIFWPTRREIYVFDATTGAQSRSPIPLAPVSHNGANLTAAAGYLIAAGPDRLLAFGPRATSFPTNAEDSTPTLSADSNH